MRVLVRPNRFVARPCSAGVALSLNEKTPPRIALENVLEDRKKLGPRYPRQVNTSKSLDIVIEGADRRPGEIKRARVPDRDSRLGNRALESRESQVARGVSF